MIRVKIRIFDLNLRSLTGESEINLDTEASTMGELISELDKRYGGSVSAEILKRELVILLNGRNINVLDGFKTKIADGDEIVITPLFAGG